MQDTLPHLIVLSILLLILVGLHRLRATVDPLVAGVVGGLAKHAQVNAPAYGIACMFALSASLGAFYDVFSQVDYNTLHGMTWWQLGALIAKVLNPGIVAVTAYATQSKFRQANPQ